MYGLMVTNEIPFAISGTRRSHKSQCFRKHLEIYQEFIRQNLGQIGSCVTTISLVLKLLHGETYESINESINESISIAQTLQTIGDGTARREPFNRKDQATKARSGVFEPSR